jgi:hypothetical protein
VGHLSILSVRRDGPSFDEEEMLPRNAFIKQMQLILGIYAVNDGLASTAAMARLMQLGSLMASLSQMPHGPVTGNMVESRRRT